MWCRVSAIGFMDFYGLDSSSRPLEDAFAVGLQEAGGEVFGESDLEAEDSPGPGPIVRLSGY
jgi:hypothetical protein